MNIYVSNLSFNVNEEALSAFFTPFGEVSSAKVIMDKMTNRSRGFGFVEMPDGVAAQKAIDSLNGSTSDNRTIRVVEARPKAAGDVQGGSFPVRERNYNNANSYNKNHY